MPETSTSPSIAEACAILRAGGLLAIPTETVYGLAADARNPDAIAKIFALKQRPKSHPLIVHIADAGQLPNWAVAIPDAAYQLARAFWPGPLTLILNKHPDVPDAVTGGQATIGLRSPDSPLTLALLGAFGGGLAAPSANRFGRLSPTSAQHVRDEFGEQSPPVLDGGECGIGIESTIVDLTNKPPRILREGSIRLAQLQVFLPDIQSGQGQASPRVSGSLDAHYAPRTAMRRRTRAELGTETVRGGVVLALKSLPEGSEGIALPDSADEYARGLYSALRQLDARHATEILIEQTPDGPEWLAVNDRISRALAGAGVSP